MVHILIKYASSLSIKTAIITIPIISKEVVYLILYTLCEKTKALCLTQCQRQC